MALLLATCTCAAYATWHQGGIIARGSRSAASTSSLPLVTLRLPVKLGVIRMLEQEDEGSSSGSSSSSSSSSSDGGVAVAVVESGSSRNSKQEETTASEDWSGFLLRERYTKLRDIALTISVRRTIDEAELALKLADDFNSDPSILQDIDFKSLIRRVERDLAGNNAEVAASKLMDASELKTLEQRQRKALDALQRVQPEILAQTAEGAVETAVPKIRRVISKARELPLTIELPAAIAPEGALNFSLALNESKNVAASVKEVWQRLNGADVERDLELVSLQRETKALLALRAEVRCVLADADGCGRMGCGVGWDARDTACECVRQLSTRAALSRPPSFARPTSSRARPGHLRALLRAPPSALAAPPHHASAPSFLSLPLSLPPSRHWGFSCCRRCCASQATKLRSGIRLVQRQKELKSAYLVRFGESADLLGETLRADSSIAKLETELSLKAALLEMERIYITLESELSVTSTLVDQLLQAVERYGGMESSLRGMVGMVQKEMHANVNSTELEVLERDISLLLLQLGLTAADSTTEAFSWSRTREQISVNLNKAGEGLAFYVRGTQLVGQDLQLVVSMLSRAVVQGYTLRAREVKLLRRIGKDLLTIIPFIIILIIPLSPLGHVLVFSFIQRFFPDFFPSQFTESRQNIMSMYSSITAPSEEPWGPEFGLAAVSVAQSQQLQDEQQRAAEAEVEGAAAEGADKEA